MRTVYIEGLGRCEHCNQLLYEENMSAEAINAKWMCSYCEKILTSKSFGYEIVKGKFRKTRWVGKDGKWTKNRPANDFVLEEIRVRVRTIRIVSIDRYKNKPG